MLNSQGNVKAISQNSYMQRGTSPLTMWYCGLQNQTALGAASFGVDVLRAYPIAISRHTTVSKISIEVTTLAAAGKARAGIYRGVYGSEQPTALLLDSGEYDCSSIGVKTTSGLSVALAPGLYWLALLTGTLAATFRVSALAALPSIDGTDATLATLRAGVLVNNAYGALPAAFPAVTGAGTSNRFVIALEFA